MNMTVVRVHDETAPVVTGTREPDDGAGGGAALLAAGQLRLARARLWDEARAAEERGDGTAFARAALGLGGLWVHEHRGTLERARVLGLQRRALAAVDPASDLAERLRARLAAERAYLEGDGTDILTALDQARRRGDPDVLAEVLSLVHHCVLGPHHRHERLDLADELIAVAPATDRPLAATMGLAWRTVDLVLAGDRRAARSLRELRAHLAEHPCAAVSYLVDGFDVTFALRSGDLAGAERLAAEAHRRGTEVGDADADAWHAAQLLAVRWMQGRAGELLDLVVDLDESTSVPELNEAFTAAVAFVAADAGAEAPARRALSRLRAGGLAELTPSSAFLATMAAVCDAAHLLGDAEAAAEAHGILLPFADLPVMASLGVACFGSVRRPLGLAAWTAGDLDGAVAHLEDAAADDLALGNRPSHAIVLGTLAAALDERNRPGDAARALEARTEAVAEARRLGMDGWLRRWQVPATSAVPVRCARQGRTWLVSVGDRTVAVRHGVGLAYLAELTANPDTAIPAVALASGHVLVERGAPPEALVDDEAKAHYRRRLAELQAEVDEADDHGDPERASLARLELDGLVEELARVAGWQGQTRTFTDDVERARVSVRKALARALAAIAEADAGLAEAISARLTTGVRCTFHTRAPGTT